MDQWECSSLYIYYVAWRQNTDWLSSVRWPLERLCQVACQVTPTGYKSGTHLSKLLCAQNMHEGLLVSEGYGLNTFCYHLCGSTLFYHLVGECLWQINHFYYDQYFVPLLFLLADNSDWLKWWMTAADRTHSSTITVVYVDKVFRWHWEGDSFVLIYRPQFSYISHCLSCSIPN